MNEHQEARRRFIDEREVFADTKTPELISLKLLEEVGELLTAYSEYARFEPDSKRLQAVRDESADVVSLLFDIAINCGFSLGDAVKGKLDKDKKRFPQDEMRRQEGLSSQEVYLRRKRTLGERPNPLPSTRN